MIWIATAALAVLVALCCWVRWPRGWRDWLATLAWPVAVATVLLLASPASAAPPPCDSSVGPPWCAAADWMCLSPDRRTALARFVASCEADADIYQVDLGAVLSRHAVLVEATRARHAVEREAWAAEQAALLALYGQTERALAAADRGHPTWVVVLSTIGGAVVMGGAVGVTVWALSR